jgi:hypothetical protein
MPGGYNDEHVTRYTRDKLTEIVTGHGFVVEQVAYMGGGDMFMRCRKPEPARPDAIGPASTAA